MVILVETCRYRIRTMSLPHQDYVAQSSRSANINSCGNVEQGRRDALIAGHLNCAWKISIIDNEICTHSLTQA